MAKDILSYKGYTVKVLYDAAARRLYGKVEGISADVAFETTQSAQAFAEAVDAYLARCQAAGVAPERQYRGLFNVRLSPEAHREMARWALVHDMSLNKAMELAVTQFLNGRA